MALFKKKPKAIVPEPPRMHPYHETEEVKAAIEAAPGDDIGNAGEGGLPELPELPEGETETDAEELVEEIEKEEEREKEEGRKIRAESKLTQEIGERPKLPKREKPAAREIRKPAREKEREARALFIKIDKFKEILVSMELMESKASELEDIIRKLREVKTKEEQLMTSWQQEIEELKTKIASIERALAEKID